MKDKRRKLGGTSRALLSKNGIGEISGCSHVAVLYNVQCFVFAHKVCMCVVYSWGLVCLGIDIFIPARCRYSYTPTLYVAMQSPALGEERPNGA